jgi:hypothetical protein
MQRVTASLHKVDGNVATQVGSNASGGEPSVTSRPPAAPPRDVVTAGDDHHYYLAVVTRKLVTVTMVSLASIGLTFYSLQAWVAGRSFLVLIIFAVGLIGGFVSLQQRLPKTSTGDLKRLSATWFAILLVPINGGIFAIVLHLAFLGKIVQGDVFPSYLPSHDALPGSGAAAVSDWLKNVAPANATELGKLLFWAFVAGFSERLVPQILQQRVSLAGGEEGRARPKPQEGSPQSSGQGQSATPKPETP